MTSRYTIDADQFFSRKPKRGYPNQLNQWVPAEGMGKFAAVPTVV